MSHTIENKYIGNLRTSSKHLKSGNNVVTDAPKDNNGKGEAFSPTDLVSSALCSCMSTVMGICANKGNFSMPNSMEKITKIMGVDPRKISEIMIEFTFEKSELTDAQKNKLISIAKNCPVAKSLNPDIKQNLTFKF
jgi:uncharacterized OsmC-like protein